MSDERDVRRERMEREEEALVDLVHDYINGGIHSPLWRSKRFVDWMAEEVRDRDRKRWTDAQLLAAGERMMARVRARQAPVRRVYEHPPQRPPAVEGSPATVLDAAAAARATPVVELGVAAGVGRDLWEETCDSWIELPEDVPNGRYVALRIVGDSMEPLMHTGDTVLVKVGGPVKRNAVIVARHPENGYVCKRVAALTSRMIELASLDASREPITIPRDHRLIVGTVIMVWCTHRER
jgi:SOS-response transcriptional repressor LexA